MAMTTLHVASIMTEAHKIIHGNMGNWKMTTICTSCMIEVADIMNASRVTLYDCTQVFMIFDSLPHGTLGDSPPRSSSKGSFSGRLSTGWN